MLREYVVHRSVYHLKEADPHALLIPRLSGRAKAGVVTVEFDEYGAGTRDGMHAVLFADLMRGLGLDAAYGAYLDRVPAPMLAVVNLMSLFGWHRSRRAMMAGHFAAADGEHPAERERSCRPRPGRRRGRRAPRARFFTEHIEGGRRATNN
ncbi:iron-containing redox enzyme family protein [Yinghuangia aomiensis]